jgi:hypothetical protein
MIQFKVSGVTSLVPEEIVEGMLDKANWLSFNGSGLIPGIQDVEIIPSDKSIEGTVFKVTNSDGSSHEEVIISYEPPHSLIMKLHKFGFPLNRIATHFFEKWTYRKEGEETYFERSFEFYPKNFLGTILLKLIAKQFKKAVIDHNQAIINADK